MAKVGEIEVVSRGEGESENASVVAYDASGPNWTLSISDNGVGKPHEGAVDATSGLGTSIVQALAKELDASVDFVSSKHGTTVTITHAAHDAAAVA